MTLIARYRPILAAAALLLAPIALRAQVPTQVLVAVDAKIPAPLAQADVTLKVGGKAALLTGWAPVLSPAGGGVQLAVLIDDSLRESMTRQIADMQNFITRLPPSVLVFVGFIQSSHVVVVHDFSNNHAEVAAAVHAPLGARGGASNPFFALADMAKRWPMGPQARIALMLTNGVDPANAGGPTMNADGESMNTQDSTNIRSVTDTAEKAGIVAYSIFYNEKDLPSDTLASGQSYLAQLAEVTGGFAYAEGQRSPIMMAPLLQRFQDAIASTYVATFAAPAGKKLVTVKVATTAHDMKVRSQDAVLPGNAEAPPAK